MKLAIIALVAGMMLAAIVVTQVRPRAAPAIAAMPRQAAAARPDVTALHHCRILTMPDAGCEAAWEAERLRFFHEADR